MKLLSAGYEHLSERDAWDLKKGGKCGSSRALDLGLRTSAGSHVTASFGR